MPSTKEQNQRERDKLRDEIYRHYGNKCACCGVREKFFLTLDHVGENGRGSEHRKLLGSSSHALMRWIRKNNFPDSIQLMCFNCNCGRARNGGICPHKSLGVNEVA